MDSGGGQCLGEGPGRPDGIRGPEDGAAYRDTVSTGRQHGRHPIGGEAPDREDRHGSDDPGEVPERAEPDARVTGLGSGGKHGADDGVRGVLGERPARLFFVVNGTAERQRSRQRRRGGGRRKVEPDVERARERRVSVDEKAC